MSCSISTMVSERLSSAISARDARGGLGAQARGRLVEEQQARPRGERDADLERAPVAVGEVLGADVLLAGEPDPCRESSPPSPSERPKHREPRRPHLRRGDQHVVERAVVVEQIHHLERARDAEARDARGGRPVMSRPSKVTLPRSGA